MDDLSEDRLIHIITKPLSRVVCAPKGWPQEKVAAELNSDDPSGTDGGWQISDRDTNPVQCEGLPDRWHWLLDC